MILEYSQKPRTQDLESVYIYPESDNSPKLIICGICMFIIFFYELLKLLFTKYPYSSGMQKLKEIKEKKEVRPDPEELKEEGKSHSLNV